MSMVVAFKSSFVYYPMQVWSTAAVSVDTIRWLAMFFIALVVRLMISWKQNNFLETEAYVYINGIVSYLHVVLKVIIWYTNNGWSHGPAVCGLEGGFVMGL